MSRLFIILIVVGSVLRLKGVSFIDELSVKVKFAETKYPLENLCWLKPKIQELLQRLM
jgi:hypothetical protein